MDCGMTQDMVFLEVGEGRAAQELILCVTDSVCHEGRLDRSRRIQK